MFGLRQSRGVDTSSGPGVAQQRGGFGPPAPGTRPAEVTLGQPKAAGEPGWPGRARAPAPGGREGSGPRWHISARAVPPRCPNLALAAVPLGQPAAAGGPRVARTRKGAGPQPGETSGKRYGTGVVQQRIGCGPPAPSLGPGTGVPPWSAHGCRGGPGWPGRAKAPAPSGGEVRAWGGPSAQGRGPPEPVLGLLCFGCVVFWRWRTSGDPAPEYGGGTPTVAPHLRDSGGTPTVAPHAAATVAHQR